MSVLVPEVVEDILDSGLVADCDSPSLLDLDVIVRGLLIAGLAVLVNFSPAKGMAIQRTSPRVGAGRCCSISLGAVTKRLTTCCSRTDPTITPPGP